MHPLSHRHPSRDYQNVPTPVRVPYLLSMYTEPEFRGMDIASSIVKEAMKRCRK